MLSCGLLKFLRGLVIFKQQQETEKKYLDQTRKCTLPPKKKGLFETIARKKQP